MTTESSNAGQPLEAYAIAFRVDDALRLGRMCKTQECAEHSVSIFEGSEVVGMLAGVLLPLPTPLKGMPFALRRGETPEGETVTPRWKPDAAHINALPAAMRDAFKRVEQNTDPAGELRQVRLLEERVRQLEAELVNLAGIGRRALPFLKEAGAAFEDDGSNEPLETFRDLSAAVEGIGDA